MRGASVIDVIRDASGIEFNNICRALYMAPWDMSAPRIHDQVKQSQGFTLHQP
jgi:hypothetical protein